MGVEPLCATREKWRFPRLYALCMHQCFGQDIDFAPLRKMDGASITVQRMSGAVAYLRFCHTC